MKFVGIIPHIFFAFIFSVGVYYSFFVPKKDTPQEEAKLQKVFKKLIVIVLIFKVVFALLLTIYQYFIWQKNPLSSVLLNLKLERGGEFFLNYFPILFKKEGGYFVYYVFFRFWLEIIITLILAFAFYFFLEFLRKKNERFLFKSDSLLCLWGGIINGWPFFIVFFLAFLFSFITSGLVGKVKGKKYIPIRQPLWIGISVGVFLGVFLLRSLGLDFLILFKMMDI